MTLHHIGLGVKFGGNCPVCHRNTGVREFEKAATSLYKDTGGHFHPVHPGCAGGRTKSAVGGSIKYRTEPNSTIEVS